jgi:diguanylate cyclase (GGDEF)-like protein
MWSFGLIAILLSNIAARLDAEISLSRRDTLTLLPNSRAFYEYAEILLAGAKRSRRPFTMAYIDLDNFKEVNDKYGHPQGDVALREAADVLRRATRSSDIAARLGGDEFALLLPDTGPEAAQTVLDRISKLLKETMRQHEWPVTASIGAASFLQAPDTVDQAVQAADSIMYRVKEAGKGHVGIEVVDSGGAEAAAVDRRDSE